MGWGRRSQVTLSGASWSTALLPLAVLQLATAVAALAVRGWALRALAALLALASFAVGYLGVSLWAIPDVAVRGADLAHIPLVALVGSERHYLGAVAAVLIGGVHLDRRGFVDAVGFRCRVGCRAAPRNMRRPLRDVRSRDATMLTTSARTPARTCRSG